MIKPNQITQFSILFFVAFLMMSFKVTASNSQAKNAVKNLSESTGLTSKAHQRSFLENLVIRSDLIFRGELTKISYGYSIEEIPYTFITYDIKEVIVGEYSNHSITLKFVGGEFPNGNRLTATNTPEVQLGEDAILMVQQSRNTGCDIVECEHGRFVLEKGSIIAANESALIVDNKGGIDYISLPARKSGQYNSSLTKSNIPDFISSLKALDKKSLSLRKSARSMVIDTDKHSPFKAYPALTRAQKGPPVPGNALQNKTNPRQLKGSQQDRWEVEELRKNGGNPVLKKSYSKDQN